MYVTGVSLADVELIVRAVSATHYGGNIEIRTSAHISRNRCRFTLRTIDTAGSGARGSSGWSSNGTGPRGLRRTVAACWHVHYRVLDVLFSQYPAARVTTRVARYDADNFHDAAMDTSYENVGAPICPRTAPECCECDHQLFLLAQESFDVGICGSNAVLDMPAAAALWTRETVGV